LKRPREDADAHVSHPNVHALEPPVTMQQYMPALHAPPDMASQRIMRSMAKQYNIISSSPRNTSKQSITLIIHRTMYQLRNKSHTWLNTSSRGFANSFTSAGVQS
jgi:hypothetical protein